MADDLVPVRVRDCPNGSHPEGDFAYLKPRADLEIGFAANALIGRTISDPALMTIELGKAYLRFGIVKWDLHEPSGQAWPLGLDSLGRLNWATEVYPIADKAAELYGDVLDPLVASLSNGSPSGRTGGSTSATRPSSPKPRKR